MLKFLSQFLFASHLCLDLQLKATAIESIYSFLCKAATKEILHLEPFLPLDIEFVLHWIGIHDVS